MKEQIEQVLSKLAGQRADRRFHVFDVKLSNEGKLEGRVLEDADLRALREALPTNIDVSSVRVLRQKPSVQRVVSTNLTDLHVGPSFLDEMLTQVVNGMSLEVLEKKSNWCFVRQPDGYLGWTYAPCLQDTTVPTPTHIVCTIAAPVMAQPASEGVPLTLLMTGTKVRVSEQRESWGRIEPAGSALWAGWVKMEQLRPLNALPLPPEKARAQLVADACALTGVYYLWGGTSGFGLDCSGMTHLVHRLCGYDIPRDANVQYPAGRPVEPPFQPGDLLFFCGDDRAKITHVGISTGGWNMIHSSRSRNGVYEEDVQAVPHLRDRFVGATTFLSNR